MLAADAAVAVAVFGLEHLISYCNHDTRCFGPTSRGQGRRLCHAMPNHSPGEVNPKQQLPFCCRSPCESRDCCAAVAVPSGSELPSSLMLIQQYIMRPHTYDTRYVLCTRYVPGICRRESEAAVKRSDLANVDPDTPLEKLGWAREAMQRKFQQPMSARTMRVCTV